MKSNILSLVVASLPILFSGCIISDEPQPSDNGEVTLTLNVSPVSRATDDVEKWTDLRVIIFDDTKNLEYNGTYNEINATPYKVTVTNLNPGKKTIYLIGNEGELTSKLYDDNLSSEALESISFTPDYTTNIPLSAIYDLELKEGANNQTMYLVRTATKFTFSFTNSVDGDNSIYLTKLELHKTAGETYLFAHIPEDKKLLEDDLYWIDWMKKVADATTEGQDEEDNETANTSFGWMTGYSLPQEEHTARTLSSNPIEIKKDNTIGLGPFYFCESDYNADNENLTDNEPLSEGQLYGIHMWVKKTESADAIEYVKNITNLKTLFRNTHVMVKVNFKAGTDDIYVEIQDWNTNTSYGTVDKE